MRRVYSSPYIVDCDQLRMTLALAGIESVMKNEYGNPVGLAVVGGVADFAAPEVWVDDGDYAEALKIAEKKTPAHQPENEAEGGEWICPRCGERVGETMGACWKCERERPSETRGG